MYYVVYIYVIWNLALGLLSLSWKNWLGNFYHKPITTISCVIEQKRT